MARFLVDENVSPALAPLLRAAGHEALHVNDIRLNATADAVIMLEAAHGGFAVITHDSDYIDNLRVLGATRPSVIQVVQSDRDGVAGREAIAGRLAEVLPAVATRLHEGVAVTVGRSDLHVTALPLERSTGREARRDHAADRAAEAVLAQVRRRRPAPVERTLER